MYVPTSKNEDKIKYIVGVYFNLKLIDINKNVLIHLQKFVFNHFTECSHCTIIYFGILKSILDVLSYWKKQQNLVVDI